MKDHITHTHYRTLLAEAASGELSNLQREELQRHAQDCATCREEFASIEALAELLASRPPLVISDEMLKDARVELRARIRIERRASERSIFSGLIARWFDAPGPRLAVVGTLTMVLGLGLGYVFFGSPSADTGFPARTAVMMPGTGQGGSQITAVRFIDADASDGEVELAFQAIRPMRLRGAPDDPAIQKLLAYALVTEPNAGVRIRTVNTLTENAHPETDPEIRTALVKVVKYDTNPGVRKQAMHALTLLPMDADIKSALLYVLANDPNEGLRIDAIDALLPDRVADGPDDDAMLEVLKNRMQNENNNYIRLRTKAALQEVQP
jgi:anti-sigma factor RsiW